MGAWEQDLEGPPASAKLIRISFSHLLRFDVIVDTHNRSHKGELYRTAI